MLVLKPKEVGARSSAEIILSNVRDFPLNEAGFSPRLEFGELGAFNTAGSADRICLLGADDSRIADAFGSFSQKNAGAGLLVLCARPSCVSGAGFAKRAFSEGLESSKLVMFGIRNWSGEEKSFIDDNRIKHFTMRHVNISGFSNAVDGLTETVSGWPALYLHIDIAVADPSCAPAVDSPEPGGLTARQLINIVQRLRLLRKLKMVSISGFDSKKDVNGMTSMLAAKLLVELG